MTADWIVFSAGWITGVLTVILARAIDAYAHYRRKEHVKAVVREHFEERDE